MRKASVSSVGRFGPLTKSLMVFAAMVITAIGIAETANAVPRRVKRECRGDYKSLCPHYKAGTSRMRSCMRAKGSQLSWGCYQALKDHGYVRSGRRR